VLHLSPDSEHRPDACPFCRAKAIGTLAKVITTRTYWRCQACGEVWNVANLRSTSKDYRYRYRREG
jgi:transposase-like protein